MKKSILNNLDTIGRLFSIVETLSKSVSEVEDKELKKELEKQVLEMIKSVNNMIKQTRKLFDAYKDSFKE